MATASHGVAGQALGYVHQCLWALVELAVRAAEDPAFELRLEGLDDIQFDLEGSPVDLLQLKHHVGTPAVLSINSVDLWRSLNVWMDVPSDLNVVLRLVTTAQVGDNSDLAGLRPGTGRDVDNTIAALLAAAKASDNKTTASWRQRFIDLDESERENLVDRIVIEDASPRAPQLNDALTKAFRYSAPRNTEVFIELLKGWWTGVAIDLLAGSLEAVTGHDLLNAVADCVDQLKSDTLPVDPAILLIGRPDTEGYETRCFVRQLLWIALDETRLWKAIRDYHRSYTQRSFWLRYQLVSELEIDRFAFRLHDEWEQVFDRRKAAMIREGRLDKDVVGQEILDDLARESRARLRERFEESWFNRGMFHALADGELSVQIGWHPEFQQKLEEMLVDATS
ncbi:ABC-three component system protein [Mycolicibacterium sediminis]|uniref:ABC-three component systems C-terminal domain-containing protein n=1 Tax=Mycolicibacterium sediminis TaxID=1286180 RepID=A0A7I7QR22_9MYCO|nr:ABC-three component system protein [Mycolicibacterium sediminis]BBY28735.1 hypothetical protein MSEDJ_28310 [Mycolicibacterium sediminis]